MRGSLALSRLLPISALLVLAACTGGEPAATTAPSTTPTPVGPTTTTAETAGSNAEEPVAMQALPDDLTVLPEREGPRRQTTGDVPHQQLDVEPVAEVDAELRRRVFALPGVEDRASERSLPGARALWLVPGLDVVNDDVLGGSREGVLGSNREFAHIHPDGSLHVWLPVERAIEVHETKWGELHPWVDREGFWDGVVMVYVPESMAELEVTLQIVVDAYNYITGDSLSRDDIP